MTLPVDELEIWQTKLEELRRSELDSVRAVAAKWQGTIAALLGLFGTVSFVSGPTTIATLDQAQASMVKGAVVVAVVLALVALLLATYASHGVPLYREDMDGQKLYELSKGQARRSLMAMRGSQVAALLAAAIVVTGSSIILVQSPSKEPAKTEALLVVESDGSLHCGGLVSTAEGFIVVDGSDRAISLANATVHVLSNCPEQDS